MMGSRYSEAVDVLPTICEIFNLPVPPAVDGRSLVGTVYRQLLHKTMAIPTEFDFCSSGCSN
jgi:arylsulfatase A-like enzyme